MNTNPTEEVRNVARPLRGGSDDYDPLIEMVGDARFVLLGEASHGTHEFYKERDNDRATAAMRETLERTSQWETGELPETFPYGV